METRIASKVHQSPTLPATAPDVSTRNQAADQHQGFLVMVFNSETMNTLMLFNLPCLYSNVVKIKFPKNRNGRAIEQMEDHLAKE